MNPSDKRGSQGGAIALAILFATVLFCLLPQYKAVGARHPPERDAGGHYRLTVGRDMRVIKNVHIIYRNIHVLILRSTSSDAVVCSGQPYEGAWSGTAYGEAKLADLTMLDYGERDVSTRIARQMSTSEASQSSNYGTNAISYVLNCTAINSICETWKGLQSGDREILNRKLRCLHSLEIIQLPFQTCGLTGRCVRGIPICYCLNLRPIGVVPDTDQSENSNYQRNAIVPVAFFALSLTFTFLGCFWIWTSRDNRSVWRLACGALLVLCGWVLFNHAMDLFYGAPLSVVSSARDADAFSDDTLRMVGNRNGEASHLVTVA